MKKLNVGIVGLGRISYAHAAEISQYSEYFNLVACADHDPERLKDAPPQLKDAAKYASLEEMLQHPDLDMVTIATRHPDHVPMALKVLEADKIVLVEKPVATSLAEMDVMLEMGKKHPHKLFVRHNHRFDPHFVRALELMKSGLVGEPQYIKLTAAVGFCRRNDWMTMTEYYGGLLSNWGPHLIDQALQYLESPVVDIWADVRRVVSIGDGDDLCKIILKGANNRLVEIEITGANLLLGRDIEIIGNRGTIVYEKGKLFAKYIDPLCELKDLKPHPENPPKRYGNFDEKLYFVTSEYETPVCNQEILWKYLYDDAVNGIPTPITLELAREVVRITEEAFRISGFENIKNFKSKVL